MAHTFQVTFFDEPFFFEEYFEAESKEDAQAQADAYLKMRGLANTTDIVSIEDIDDPHYWDDVEDGE